jgi:hypothetical protein
MIFLKFYMNFNDKLKRTLIIILSVRLSSTKKFHSFLLLKNLFYLTSEIDVSHITSY